MVLRNIMAVSVSVPQNKTGRLKNQTQE